MKIVVAITGASGAVLGVRLLEYLKKNNVESHLIVSRMAERTIETELKIDVSRVKLMGTCCYDPERVDAKISSGSFRHDGMIIIPCSMKTMAAIACGYTSELISRAADVTSRRGPAVLPP